MLFLLIFLCVCLCFLANAMMPFYWTLVEPIVLKNKFSQCRWFVNKNMMMSWSWRVDVIQKSVRSNPGRERICVTCVMIQTQRSGCLTCNISVTFTNEHLFNQIVIKKQGRIHDQQMRLPLGRGSIGPCAPFPGLSQYILITLKFKPHISTIFTNMARTYGPTDGRTDGHTLL